MNLYNDVKSRWPIMAAAGAMALMLGLSTTAYAAMIPFGGAVEDESQATLVSDLSDSTTDNDYSGISFDDENGMPFSSLTNLAADYNVTDDDCIGGSPRFQVAVDTDEDGVSDGNVFIYMGPAPNFTQCESGWQSTGNLIGNSDAGRYDFSQLGGPGSTMYANAPADVLDGDILDISLIVDSGWAAGDHEQTILVDNVSINGETYAFEDNGGTTEELSAPSNLSPSDGAVLTSAEFDQADWSDVEASSTPVTYRYESSMSSTTNGDGSFASPAFQSGSLADSEIETAGTPEGTYWWHARAVNDDGMEGPWSDAFMVTIDNESDTTPPSALEQLIESLQNLLGSFPQYGAGIQGLIDQLSGDDDGTGTTTPPVENGNIEQDGQTVRAGGSIDFGGHNFGREEHVTVRRDGAVVGDAFTNSSGSFSTGSMSLPNTAGTYVYTFTGQISGVVGTATLTVQ